MRIRKPKVRIPAVQTGLGGRMGDGARWDAAKAKIELPVPWAGVAAPLRALIAHHHVVLDPAYVHITQASIAETARIRAELGARGVHAVGRYGGWTYCSIEDNMLETRAQAQQL